MVTTGQRVQGKSGGGTNSGSLTSRKMPSKRTSKPSKSLTPNERKFVVHLAALIGDNAVKVANEVGVSHDAVLKWCRGDTLPKLDHWPKLAKAVGLKDWRDLLPPL